MVARPLSQRRPGLGLRTNEQHRTTPTTRPGYAAASEMAIGPEKDSPNKTKRPWAARPMWQVPLGWYRSVAHRSWIAHHDDGRRLPQSGNERCEKFTRAIHSRKENKGHGPNSARDDDCKSENPAERLFMAGGCSCNPVHYSTLNSLI
jgi:hypothetical protein